MEIKKYNKKCAKCGKAFITKHITKAYCKSCFSKYLKEYNLKHKSNYIYMFKSIDSDDIYYIGSTTNINNRISKHLNYFTDVLNILNNLNLQYNIIFAEIKKEDLTRDELYFVEYYLIHKYFLINNKVPVCNKKQVFNNNLSTSRQIQLINLAENLTYSKFNLLKYLNKKSLSNCN